MDKLFEGDMDWVQEDPFIPRFHEVPDWGSQINYAGFDEYLIKYCEPEYYALLTKSVRDYKHKRRVSCKV